MNCLRALAISGKQHHLVPAAVAVVVAVAAATHLVHIISTASNQQLLAEFVACLLALPLFAFAWFALNLRL